MCRRAVRKLTMTWPGRAILLSLLLLLLLSCVPTVLDMQEEDARPQVSVLPKEQGGKEGSHRWTVKTDRPKPLVDLILPEDKPQVKSESQAQEEIRQRMKARQLEMKAACSRHGLDVRGDDQLHQPNPWEYFINLKHSFAWCNVFKSGSTSWMYVLNILAGYSEQFLSKTAKVPLTLARDRYPRPSVAELEEILHLDNVTSLIIARHPFERLVSSYKDKIVGALAGTVHDKLRRSITLKYRPESLPRDLRGRPKLPRVRKLPVQFIPTFAEFIQHVVDESEANQEPDMHWAPVYRFCNPCQVNINTIAKMETLDEDTEYILKKIHVSQNKIHMSKKNSALDGKSASEVTNSYLRSIEKPLYEKLLKLYVIDFDIFGYKPFSFEDL